MSYLFDTNVGICFLGKIVLSETALKRLDGICEQGAHLSIITKLELLGYNFENEGNENSTKNLLHLPKYTR